MRAGREQQQQQQHHQHRQLGARCAILGAGRTEKVDDGVVVAGEEADEVLEERDERRVHHAVVDLRLPRLHVAQCTMHNAHGTGGEREDTRHQTRVTRHVWLLAPGFWTRVCLQSGARLARVRVRA